MKVKEREKVKGVAFNELKRGDVFRFDNDLYMVIDPCGGDENAVDLEEGELSEFACYDIVLPVDGEFVER